MLVLGCLQIFCPDLAMAALVLVVLISMALYAWVATPLIEGTTALFQALWLVWLPVLLAVWLLADRDS